MSDTSEVQEKPDQMDCEAPASEREPRGSSSSAARAGDARRYRVALGISLAVLLAVLAFGLFATLP